MWGVDVLWLDGRLDRAPQFILEILHVVDIVRVHIWLAQCIDVAMLRVSPDLSAKYHYDESC